MRKYDIFRGQANNAQALKSMAEAARKRSEESFSNCDTDGFLTQWANDLTAQQFDLQAKIAEANGLHTFTGLYQGERRVAAQITFQAKYNAPWVSEPVWYLRADEVKRFERRYIPVGKKSRIQKALGLRERLEVAPAIAATSTGGRESRGLSGCANAFVEAKRRGDEWGLDAKLVQESQIDKGVENHVNSDT